jgi:hypothetical protein
LGDGLLSFSLGDKSLLVVKERFLKRKLDVLARVKYKETTESAKTTWAAEQEMKSKLAKITEMNAMGK